MKGFGFDSGSVELYTQRTNCPGHSTPGRHFAGGIWLVYSVDFLARIDHVSNLPNGVLLMAIHT